MKAKSAFRKHILPLLTSLTIAGSGSIAQAATHFWDPSSGGGFGAIGSDYWVPNRSIIWTSSTSGATTRLNMAITNTTDSINFGGTAIVAPLAPLTGGTISVGFVEAGSINVNDMGSSMTLSGGVITLAATSTIKVDDFNSAISLTISSSIAGADTSLTKTGPDTLILTGANTYTGSTVVSAGILSLGNTLALQDSVLNATTSITGNATNGLATTVSALTFGGISGTKNLASLFSTGGAYNTVSALTLKSISGTQSYSGAIGEGATGMTLTKSGAGTQVLSGTNTFTGSTIVNSGTLTLDYATNDTSKLSNTAALVLGNGTLNFTGGTHIEIVASTTLTGAAAITQSGPGATLALGTISGTGSVNFGADNIATTTNINDGSGILGGFATVGGTNWAMNDGLDNIVAYTAGYTDVAALGDSIADSSLTNVRIFSAGAGSNTQLASATTTINTLLQSSATATTIDVGGNTLAVHGIMLASGAEVLTVGNAVNDGTVMTATPGGTLSVHNFELGRALTINSIIADNTTASGLTKSGAGTLVLAGANSYSGTTTIGAGTLSLTGSLTNSSVTIGGSAVLNQTSTGVIAGTAILTHGSTGNTTLAGANSYNGATTISSGIINIQNATALGTTAAGTTVASGAALQLQGGIAVGNETLALTGTGVSNTGALRNISGNNIWGGTITLNSATRINSDAGTLTINVTSGNAISATNQAVIFGGAGNITVSDAVNIGSGALQKDGAGTLTLSAASTFTGIANVTGGVINIRNATALGTTAQGTVIGSGAALQLQGGISVAEGLTLGSTGVSNTGGLRNISGDNTVSTAVTLFANSRINSDADTLTFSSSISGNGAAYNSPTLTFGGAGDITVSGSFTATNGVLIKDGTGTLRLNGSASTYTGSTTIQAGTLIVGANAPASTGALGNTASAVVVGNGNTTASNAPSLLIGGAFTVARAINVGFVANANAYVATLGGSNTTGTSTFSGNIILNTTANNYSFRLQAATNGTVDFTTGTWTTNNKAITIGSSGNTGTVRLSNNIATSGGINVAFGTLELNSAFTSGNLTVASGTTLEGTGSVAGTTGVTSATIDGTGLTLTGVTTFNSTGNTLSGTVTSTNGVTLASSAALTLNGALTGSLSVGNGTLTGTGGSVSGASTLNGGSISLSSGSFGSTLSVTGGSWSGAGSVSGAVTSSSGTFSVTSGANLTATSGVSVTGGNLVVDGTITGTLSTDAGTTLSGTGTISGNATIAGIHNPGSSPGIQTFGADLTYSGGASIVNLDLESYTNINPGNPNALFDQMLVAGDLNFAATTMVNLVFNGVDSTVDWSDPLWNDPQSWLVYDVTGAVTGFDNLDLNVINWLDGDDNPFLTDRPEGTFFFSNEAGGIYLNYAVIPEPSTALLGGLGVLALLRRRRK